MVTLELFGFDTKHGKIIAGNIYYTAEVLLDELLREAKLRGLIRT